MHGTYTDASSGTSCTSDLQGGVQGRAAGTKTWALQLHRHLQDKAIPVRSSELQDTGQHRSMKGCTGATGAAIGSLGNPHPCTLSTALPSVREGQCCVEAEENFSRHRPSQHNREEVVAQAQLPAPCREYTARGRPCGGLTAYTYVVTDRI